MKKTKKIMLTSMLTLALGTLSAGFLALPQNVASANTDALTTQDGLQAYAGFETYDSEIRINSPTGIRFVTKVPTELKQDGYEFGTVMLPKDMLGSAQLTVDTSDVLNVPAAKWKSETEYTGVLGGKADGNGIVADFNAANYNKTVVARGYVNANGTYYYTETMEDTFAGISAYTLATDGELVGEVKTFLTGVVDAVLGDDGFAFASETVVLTDSITLNDLFSSTNGNEGLTAIWSITDGADYVTVNTDENGVATSLARKDGVASGNVTLTATLGSYTETVTLSLKPIITATNTVTLEKANPTVTFDEEISGTVQSVVYNGTEMFNGVSDGVVSLNADAFTQYGENKTITVETDEAFYNVPANVYTMIVNDSAELDSARRLTDGYIVLGNHVTYTGEWKHYEGDWENSLTFEGTFDGKGYSIDGVNANTTGRAMWWKLTGTIKNVAFTNAYAYNSGNLLAAEALFENIENVYVHALQAGAKTSTEANWCRGGFLVGNWSWGQTVTNVYMEIDEVTTNPFDIMSSRISSASEQLTNVYVVGANANLVATAPTESDTYGSFNSRTLLAAESIDFSGWDNSVWTTDADGLPIFKSIYTPSTARINVETYNVAEVATQTFDLSDLANGTIDSVTLDGTDLTYSGTLSALTLNKSELYNNAYGEKKVYVNYTDANGESKKVAISVYVVTQELNTADELQAARAQYTAKRDSWTVVNANYYVLGNDIELGTNNSWNYGQTITDVNATANAVNVIFTGTFDGAGYNIDGAAAGGAWQGGMFWAIWGGTVKNVSFTNATLAKNGTFFALTGNGTFTDIYMQFDSIIGGSGYNDSDGSVITRGSVIFPASNNVKGDADGDGVKETLHDWGAVTKNIYVQIDSTTIENIADNDPTSNNSDKIYVNYLTTVAGISNVYIVGEGVLAYRQAGSDVNKTDNVYATRDALKTAAVNFSGWDDTVWTTDADGLPIFVNLANK